LEIPLQQHFHRCLFGSLLGLLRLPLLQLLLHRSCVLVVVRLLVVRLLVVVVRLLVVVVLLLMRTSMPSLSHSVV
jgi:hypothetical protein